MFDNYKIKKKIKKEEKKVEKKESKAEVIKDAAIKKNELASRDMAATKKIEDAEWYMSYLKENELDQAIEHARGNLYIQKNLLKERIYKYSKLYKYTKSKGKYANQERDAKKYEVAAKNSVYAYYVILQAIYRLESIKDEYQWNKLMKDLTAGYKIINEISSGSSLMTKFAYWFQKAKMDMKGDISVAAMENFYGKPIDELLTSENLDVKSSAEILVQDKILDLDEEMDEADMNSYILGGDAFSVDMEKFFDAVNEQGQVANERGSSPVVQFGGRSIDPAQETKRFEANEMPSAMGRL